MQKIPGFLKILLTDIVNYLMPVMGYSIEVWDEGKIVGGLYGVTIGHGCFGESMFSTQTDVSKMAFYALMLLGSGKIICPGLTVNWSMIIF